MNVNKSPQIIHHEALKAIAPAMRYDGKGDLVSWQKAARARLASLMGID